MRAAERAAKLDRERGAAPGSSFDAQFALATAYLVTERTAPADRAFRQLIGALESQGLERTRDAGIILNNWSVMLQRAGQFLEAAPIAERAVAIARERDTEHGAPATQLKNLGSALRTVGRTAEALPILEESVTKARAAGSPRRLVDVLVEMAAAYREAGDLDRAAQALRESEATLKAGAETFERRYAGVLEGHRARLALARGEGREALALAHSALTHEEDSVRIRFDTLFLTLVLADAQIANADFAEARVSAQRALGLGNGMLGELKHSSHVGQAHFELGLALAGQGNLQAARHELQQALIHLRSSVGPDAPSTRRAVAELARLESAGPPSR